MFVARFLHVHSGSGDVMGTNIVAVLPGTYWGTPKDKVKREQLQPNPVLFLSCVKVIQSFSFRALEFVTKAA